MTKPKLPSGRPQTISERKRSSALENLTKAKQVAPQTPIEGQSAVLSERKTNYGKENHDPHTRHDKDSNALTLIDAHKHLMEDLTGWKEKVVVLEADLKLALHEKERLTSRLEESSVRERELEAEVKEGRRWKGERDEERTINMRLRDSLRDARNEIMAITTRYDAQKTTAIQLNDQLTEARRNILALQKRVRRFPGQKEHAIQRHVVKAVQDAKTFHVRKGKAIADAVRDGVQTLAAVHHVGTEHVDGVIQTVATMLGVDKVGGVSGRSVGRICLEGDIAGKIQAVETMNNADGIVFGHDGTSHLNEDHHAFTVYAGRGKSIFMGISSLHEKTAEAQVQSMKDTIVDHHEIYNSAPRGQDKPIPVTSTARKLGGATSDHAADVKKVSRMLAEWKIEGDREERGAEVMLEMDPSMLTRAIDAELQERVRAVGGQQAWEKLTLAQRRLHSHAAYQALKIRLGSEEFGRLSEDEKEDADRFLWTGCGCHKDLNAFKYGTTGQKRYWEANPSLPQPILLMNKSMRAVADAATHREDATMTTLAEDASDGGGVKLTNLVGAWAKNKDSKKGQQRMHNNWWLAKRGYYISFPDTSNTRYGTNGDAATELVCNRECYIEEFEDFRDAKQARTFTNLEANCYKGLRCQSTQTDLHSMAIYSQSVSIPYMLAVREKGLNGAALSALHGTVIQFIERVVANPDILLGSDADVGHLTFNGKPWTRPELWFKAQSNMQAGDVPYLRGNLLAFFEGAHTGWKRFTSEYEAGGAIDKASADELERLWRPATNDHNEGALGSLRQGWRKAPNMALHQRNARWRIKKNGVVNYVRRYFTPRDRKWLRKKACELDNLCLEPKRRHKLIEHKKKYIEKRRAKDAKKEEGRLETLKILEGVTLRTDIDAVRANPNLIKVKELDLQLEWHRVHRGQKILKTGAKQDKLERWYNAVTEYLQKTTVPASEPRGDLEKSVAFEVDSEACGRSANQRPAIDDAGIDPGSDLETFDIEASFADISICSV